VIFSSILASAVCCVHHSLNFLSIILPSVVVHTHTRTQPIFVAAQPSVVTFIILRNIVRRSANIARLTITVR